MLDRVTTMLGAYNVYIVRNELNTENSVALTFSVPISFTAEYLENLEIGICRLTLHQASKDSVYQCGCIGEATCEPTVVDYLLESVKGNALLEAFKLNTANSMETFWSYLEELFEILTKKETGYDNISAS